MKPITRALLESTHPSAPPCLYSRSYSQTPAELMRAFVKLGPRTRFVFNDLDDSGIGPVALDAARYFAALALMIRDRDLRNEALRVYARVVRDPRRAREPPRALSPDWRSRVERSLEHGFGGRFIREALGEEERARLERLLERHPRLEGAKILRGQRLRAAKGGSAGLLRFRFLAKQGRRTTVLEMKEARLGVLKQAFWGAGAREGDFEVIHGGRRFIVRDRGRRVAVDPLRLRGKKRTKAILAEASVLGRAHHGGWGSMTRPEIRAWLARTSAMLAKRWRAAWATCLDP